MQTSMSGLAKTKLLVLRIVLAIWLVAPAQAPAWAADCQEEVAKADESYRKGRFEEAIALLESCLDKPGLPKEERSKAYRLLGLTYLAQDYRDRARLAVTSLLNLVPDYKADPSLDPPPYVTMVEDVRREVYPPEPVVPTGKSKSRKKTWLLAGAGALIAGGLVAILSGGSSGGSVATIDAPPGLPDR